MNSASTIVTKRPFAVGGPNENRGTVSCIGSVRRTGRSAFTLLEVLAALAMSAILLAALLTAFSAAWRLQTQSAAREDREAPRQATLARLRADLSAVVIPSGLLAGPLIGTVNESGNDRQDEVEFVAAVGATTPESLWGDLVSVKWYLIEAEAEPGTWDLVRVEEPNLLASETADPVEVIMLNHVASFAVTWLSEDVWADSWDTTTTENLLPEAVRVRIEFVAVGNEPLPLPLELIVPFEVVAPTLASATTTTGGTTP